MKAVSRNEFCDADIAFMDNNTNRCEEFENIPVGTVFRGSLSMYHYRHIWMRTLDGAVPLDTHGGWKCGYNIVAAIDTVVSNYERLSSLLVYDYMDR